MSGRTWMMTFGAVTAIASVAAAPSAAYAIPAWARRYNMNCSGCHSPAVPRLNATGIGFKWAGYRMPDDIGVAVQVQKIENYLAARIVTAYDYVTRKGAADEANKFSVPGASVFAAGPFGKNYGAYLEFERTPDATIDLIASVTGVWGNEHRWGGFRVAQGHMLLGSGGVAGFDRQTAISKPLAFGESVTSGVPLVLAGDQAGAEAFVVLGGRNRTAIQVLNGLVVGAGNPSVTKRDIALTNQLMWDDAGSGIGVAAYFGDIVGLVPNQPGAGRRYSRLVATANKIVGRAEVMAGYAYGRDRDLPTDTLGVATRSVSGASYWVQGQYTLPRPALTLLGRYEAAEPDRSIVGESRRRYVIGAVLPISLPEYLRWSAELYRDSWRDSSIPQRTGLLTRLQVAF